MLRAASGRLPRYAIQQRFHSRPSIAEPLLLPFLCPAISTSSRWLRNSSTDAAADTNPTSTARPPAYSTVPFPDLLPSLDGDFAKTNGMDVFGTQQNETSGAQPPEANLVIVDTPVLRDTVRRKARMVAGISENKHEVLATFEACIRVGRIARAQLMLTVITNQFDRKSPLLIRAHNMFLKALLGRAVAEKSHYSDGLRVFFSWYQDKMMRELGLTGDATTFAFLLEASVLVAIDDPPLGKRYMVEYVEMWKGLGRDIMRVFDLNILPGNHIITVAQVCGLTTNELPQKHQEIYTEVKKDLIPEITKIPAVTSSNVKGSSLDAVKQSIESLTDPNSMPSRNAYGQDDMAFQVERQRMLERDALESAQDRWKKDHEKLASQGLSPVGNSVNGLLWAWHQAMVPLIKQELERVDEAENNPSYQSATDRCLYGPFLRLMSPDKVAAVVVLEMIRMQNSQLQGEGTKSSAAVMGVGKIMEQEYYAQEIGKSKNREFFGLLDKEGLAELFNNKAAFRSRVKMARKKQQEHPTESSDLMLEWPGAVKAKLGAVLISMMLHCSKVPITKVLDNGEKVTQLLPALNHGYEYIRGRRLGVLKLHADVIKRLGFEPLRGSSMGRNLPMLVPPLPWMAWNEGGYFQTRSKVVRTKSSREQDIYVQTASNRGDLDQLFQGLDVLGQTAWKINRRVFDTILHVWNEGEEFADIPPKDIDLVIPPEPENSTTDIKARMEWVKQVREIKHKEKSNHSQRCNINLKLEIARAFLFEKFYFPHNVDFRGRAYPIPPNLNHIGDDLSRGLLMFSEGKELGESGLMWLKIHCANLAGFDKASFTERVKYIENNIEEVKDSAEDPLGGRRWWLKAEDPWQCLATCISITEALKLEDPTKYKCQTPVAQDGTCNGLQHYAALGGDMEGARQVNLEPSDRPQDVYTGVAELVRAQVEIDAAAGDPTAQMLRGHITRKVVKQSVMTNVYGVTFIGARAQIQKQLEDNPAIPRAEALFCAGYLARLVFGSIKTVFTGATKIQHWLALTARMISRSVSPLQYASLGDHETKLRESENKHIRRKGMVEFMTSVVWTTPLRMAVVQPYRQENSVVVQTNLQKIYISDPAVIDQVNSQKQMTAFPPNFIHSLDATHMLLSATKCAEKGITFAAVHDSFWTHPADIDRLNTILREAFIELHTVDIMEKLKEEFETRYRGYKYLVTIPAGTVAARKIRMARKVRAASVHKKLGLTVVEDLQWELERDQLLASDDPEERKRGAEMLTPSEILRQAGGVTAIETMESIGPELGGVDAGQPDDKEGAEASDIFSDDDTVSDVHEEPDDEDVVVQDAVQEHMEMDSDEAEAAAEAAEESEDAAASVKKAIKKKMYPTVPVWMPLDFPPLPPKGGFDVSRLKESQYFFS